MSLSRRSNRKKQSQLTFSPLPSSSPARQSQPEAIRERVAKISYSISPNPSKRSLRSTDVLPSPKLSSQPIVLIPTQTSSPLSSRPTRSFFLRGQVESTQNPKRKLKSSQNTSLAIFDDSESDIGLPPLLSSPKSTNKPTLSDSDSDVVPSTARSVSRRATKAASSNIYIDSDSDVQILSSARKRRKVTHVSSDEDDDATRVPTRAATRNTPSSIQKSSNREDEDDDDSGSNSIHTDPHSDSEVVHVSDKNRKASNRQQEDLDEDMEFLKDTDNVEALRSTGQRSQKTAKQQALEALKRKRDKGKLHGRSPPRNTEKSQEDQEDTEDDEEIEELSDILNPADHDEYDDDFIDENEDETMGAPVDIPVEFTHYAKMKASELFQYAVEWMVQKKINPAFAIEDDLYLLAFRRLDDMVKGLGASKYQSSAWVSEFLASLKARPEIASHRFVNDGMMRDHCDACNRSNHPATWEVQFNGNSYDKETLEQNSDDEDEDDYEQRREVNPIPPAGKRYYLGRFCMQNARIAHALAHWRFHLNEWVVDYLEAEGLCTPEKIVERDRWSTKKRRRYANKIVDRMAEAGEIKRLHRDFKNEIEDAQERQQSKYDRSSP